MEHENTDPEFDRLAAGARRILESNNPPTSFRELVERVGASSPTRRVQHDGKPSDCAH